MVLYVVNVTVRKDIQDEWLKWMKEVHIPAVIATGYFIKADIFTVIVPVKTGNEITYSIQYQADSYEKFMSYSIKESKRLQKEHTEKFGSSISAERFVLEKAG